MTKRALITGVAGQDGRYLSELLLADDYEVFGVPGPGAPGYEAWAEKCGPAYRSVDADMTDAASLVDAVAEARPDEVYNLAGLSSVGTSWEHAIAVADVNATGVVRLLEALRVDHSTARFCQASSADIFGTPDRTPQTEDTRIDPLSPYAVSKAFAHFITRAYRNAHGMFACNAVLYNHESPLRPLGFVVRKITHGAASIKLGLSDELRLGNLDVRRDWGFAGDYVRAMAWMLRADEPDDYIVASGKTRSVREVCEIAFGHLGLDYRDYVIEDPAFYRPAEIEQLLGDPSRARTKLGWVPEVDFESLVADMVDADVAALELEGTASSARTAGIGQFSAEPE